MRIFAATCLVVILPFVGCQPASRDSHDPEERTNSEQSGKNVAGLERQTADTVAEVPRAPRDPACEAKSAFANVNGLPHHYLDWGGDGEPVLLLAGLCNTAHIFESFGSKLSKDFRVLALTRRGHGQSASPESGYDTKTRVEDVRGFLDFLNIDKAILIGHSIAGDEITMFAATYPERTAALVYIDAAYDRTAIAGLMADNPLVTVPIPTDITLSYDRYATFMRAYEPALETHWKHRASDFDAQLGHRSDGTIELRLRPAVYAQLENEMSHFRSDYGRVQAPVLAFYASSEKHPVVPSFVSDELREQADEFWKHKRMPMIRDQMRLFKGALPDATTIELKETDHFCFISCEARVLSDIRNFLKTQQTRHIKSPNRSGG